MQSLQNFFYTDKWWGKTIFIITLYIFYILIFYIGGTLFIGMLQDFTFGGPVMLTFLFLISPVVSFYIPSLIRKTFYVNKITLYILHTIFVILIPFIFIFIVAYLAFSNFSSIG